MKISSLYCQGQMIVGKKNQNDRIIIKLGIMTSVNQRLFTLPIILCFFTQPQSTPGPLYKRAAATAARTAPAPTPAMEPAPGVTVATPVPLAVAVPVAEDPLADEETGDGMVMLLAYELQVEFGASGQDSWIQMDWS